jgi:hypothetical protein
MGTNVSPGARVRVTAATVRRSETFHRLIARLELGEMARDEFAEFLGFSASGARKYIQELRAAGIMHALRYIDPSPSTAGEPVYSLTGDIVALEIFLRTLDQARPPVIATTVRKTVFPNDPARNFHIMQDDTRYSINIAGRKIPAPDPLLAAFYGMAGAAE